MVTLSSVIRPAEALRAFLLVAPGGRPGLLAGAGGCSCSAASLAGPGVCAFAPGLPATTVGNL